VDVWLFGFTDEAIYDCGDAMRPAVTGLVAGQGAGDD